MGVVGSEITFSLLFQLMLVLFVAKSLGALFYKIGQPEVLGEIIAGLILGPSVLNVIEPNVIFRFLAEFGVILFLFEVGLETDLRTLRRMGPKSVIIAAGDVAASFLAAYLFGRACGFPDSIALFLGVVFSATSIGISMRVFSDLGKLDTVEAKTVLCTAINDDIISMMMITIFFSLIERKPLTPFPIFKIFITSISFIVFTLFLGDKVIPKVMALVTEIPVRGGLLVFALILGVSTSYLASLVGLAPIIGSFIAGMLIAESREKERVIEDLTPLSRIIAPVFFILIGAAIKVRSVLGLLPLATAFILVAVVGKITGCGLAALATKFQGHQALIIGLSMIPRGEIGLILARSGMEWGLIDANIYAIIVFMILGTTLITPIFLKNTYRYYEGKEEE